MRSRRVERQSAPCWGAGQAWPSLRGGKLCCAGEAAAARLGRSGASRDQPKKPNTT
ncbi:hypothetical protein GLA29479_637 [Lysobacter antibioticus]|uniref:Uncharacterized protein n=1 Tax=Lysobacter antibioticus TaxID=84531 RepID=A0A0S2F8D8_LYSAN|nr:hypothetical protein GLA29479_637 [Lysobacter antibioticus]ALN79794.1 hypothetical protein LA76x_1638 [Lysobacter antibioticus]